MRASVLSAAPQARAFHPAISRARIMARVDRRDPVRSFVRACVVKPVPADDLETAACWNVVVPAAMAEHVLATCPPLRFLVRRRRERR
ncbi:MAG TPA: hypothetical protein VKU77_32605 [Streptosporangiaceae bacterium]|nr:hypothetical protein [Streptosporangiaceae bacterium]